MSGWSGTTSCSLVQIRAFPAVVGQLVLVGHGQRPGRARLDAQPAQDAAQVVDLVDAAVPLAGREPLLRRVVRALDVDRVRRAGPGAQLAADALLQPVRPPVELVAAVEPGRGRLLLLRVLDGVDLLEHGLEGDAEPLDRSPGSQAPVTSFVGAGVRAGSSCGGAASARLAGRRSAQADAVVVRQVQGRDRERGPVLAPRRAATLSSSSSARRWLAAGPRPPSRTTAASSAATIRAADDVHRRVLPPWRRQTRSVAMISVQASAVGMRTFQPSFMSWS